ncbi:uncharacterized protein [Centruroides vittatus]|uniref:uncharacterized protein isoform X2 n=1 Tax=Centruroides vittatus TaxID=120091 RepID=UPI00350EF5C6
MSNRIFKGRTRLILRFLFITSDQIFAMFAISIFMLLVFLKTVNAHDTKPHLSCFNVEKCNNSCCDIFQGMLHEDFELTLDVKGNNGLKIALKNKSNSCLLRNEINLVKFRERLICSLYKSLIVKHQKSRNLLYVVVASSLAVACFVTVCLIIGLVKRRRLLKCCKNEKTKKPDVFDQVDLAESFPPPDIPETRVPTQSTFFADDNPPSGENEIQMVKNDIYES